MDKSEVEQVLIMLKSGNEEAVHLKIYKNGILARTGSGGIPGITISGMSFMEDSSYFDKVMQSVSQQVLDQNVNHEEEIITGSLEYVVAFYGATSNGDHGERAAWTKSCGIRFYMDESTGLRHNLLGFVDGLTVEAIKLTNSWYFDIMMLALEKKQSTTLPVQTMVSIPKTEEGLNKDFQSYFEQTAKNDLPGFVKDKTYTDTEGGLYKITVEIGEESSTYTFVPVAAG